MVLPFEDSDPWRGNVAAAAASSPSRSSLFSSPRTGKAVTTTTTATTTGWSRRRDDATTQSGCPFEKQVVTHSWVRLRKYEIGATRRQTRFRGDFILVVVPGVDALPRVANMQSYTGFPIIRCTRSANCARFLQFRQAALYGRTKTRDRSVRLDVRINVCSGSSTRAIRFSLVNSIDYF